MALTSLVMLVLASSACAARPPDGAVWILRGGSCGEVLIRWSSHDASFSSVSYAVVPVGGSMAADLLLTAASSNSTQYTASADYTSPNIWSLPLIDLHPGTRYAVRLWEDVFYTFVVPVCELPPSAAIDSAHVLLVVGDIGTTSQSAAVMAAMRNELGGRGFAPELEGGYEPRGSAALLAVGDISYADGDPTVWDTFQVRRLPAPVALLCAEVCSARPRPLRRPSRRHSSPQQECSRETTSLS